MTTARRDRKGASQATLIRQIVLVVLLVVIALAAVYDFQVARPAAQKAHETISKAADERNKSPGEPLSAADVKELLKKSPSVTQNGPNSYIEKYTWISGLPWRSYYVWVVYTPGDKNYFQDVLLNQDLPPEYKPDYQLPTPSATPLPGEPVAVGAGRSGSAAAPSDQPTGQDEGQRRRPNQRPESESNEPSSEQPSGNPSPPDSAKKQPADTDN